VTGESRSSIGSAFPIRPAPFITGEEMLKIVVVNDGTGKENIGNYQVVVSINNRLIEEWYVKGHDRSKGWRNLLLQIVKEMPEK
jgi:hypothetical protein